MTLALDAPVASLRRLATPTPAELEARQRPRGRRDIHPADGITQTELAARLGIVKQLIQDAERRGPKVGWDLLMKYAIACGVELELVAKK